jgi:hypothetical protein
MNLAVGAHRLVAGIRVDIAADSAIATSFSWAAMSGKRSHSAAKNRE